MDEYSVDVLPGEVLAWVRADAARKSPRLWVRAAKSYWIDEVLPGESAKPAEGDDVSPVMVRGVMELTPQRGLGGWTLQLVAQDSVGLRADGEDAGYENDDNMTVKAFEDDFLFPEYGEVEVVVLAEDATAWRRFGRWLARKRAPLAPAGAGAQRWPISNPMQERSKAARSSSSRSGSSGRPRR